MSKFYGLTLNTTVNSRSGRAPGIKAYMRSLDTLEKKYAVEIFPRMFETAPKTGKLHVHCLVTQSLNDEPITKMVSLKSHRVHFEPLVCKAAWLNYISKEAEPSIVRSKRLV